MNIALQQTALVMPGQVLSSIPFFAALQKPFTVTLGRFQNGLIGGPVIGHQVGNAGLQRLARRCSIASDGEAASFSSLDNRLSEHSTFCASCLRVISAPGGRTQPHSQRVRQI
jgi:hypothetical protein